MREGSSRELILILFVLPLLAVLARAEEPGALEALRVALRDPWALANLLLQFGLGFGLGYISARILKYVVALAALLVLGAALNVWSLGRVSNASEAISYAVQRLRELLPELKALAGTLGVLALGPVSLGFIVGLIVAFARR
ncbi:MAG: hypothetical protein QXU97_05880 [Fervidicoccaceae archaeon]